MEDTRVEWNGLRVSKDVFEPRHPQDFVRGRRDEQAVQGGRPDIPWEQIMIPGVLYSEDGEPLQDEDGSVLLSETGA